MRLETTLTYAFKLTKAQKRKLLSLDFKAQQLYKIQIFRKQLKKYNLLDVAQIEQHISLR